MPLKQNVLLAMLALSPATIASPVHQVTPIKSPKNGLFKRADNSTSDKPSYIPKMPEKCLGTSFTTDEDRKKVWVDSGAGDLADAFIRNNDMGLENWVQNLYKLIFPNNNPMDFSCTETTPGCDAVPKCAEFEEAGYVGAYYLFRSVAAAHSWFREFKIQVLSDGIKSTLAIDQVVGDFHYKAPKESPKLNMFAIMSASFGGLSGASFMVPWASGAFGAFGGLLGVVANSKKNDEGDQPIDGADVTGSLAQMVDDSFDAANGHIDKVLRAMFSNGPQEDIPKEMQKQEWEKEAVRALGDGQWILDNPTAGLQDLGKHMSHQMKQVLAMQMIRLGRDGFVAINTEVNPSECGAAPNGQWMNDVCVDLMHFVPPHDNNGESVDDFGDELKKLWSDYGMDKTVTYNNAIKCWEANNGAIGKAGYLTDMTKLDLPECTFGMDVQKGEVTKAKYSADQIIVYDLSYPGQQQWYDRWLHPDGKMM